METRQATRVKLRLGCTLAIAGRRFSGVALDLSSTGLFVQTIAKPKRGDPVQLELRVPERPLPIVLQAEVTRIKRAPANLAAVVHGGVGLVIRSAPEEYFARLERALSSAPESFIKRPPSAGGSPASRPPSGQAAPRPGLRRAQPDALSPHFRVRIRELGGSRTRTLTIASASPDQAIEFALREAGEDWKVLACEPTD